MKGSVNSTNMLVLFLSLADSRLTCYNHYRSGLEIMYRVLLLTVPPHSQYQNEKSCSANEQLFYIENFVKN